MTPLGASSINLMKTIRYGWELIQLKKKELKTWLNKDTDIEVEAANITFSALFCSTYLVG